MRKDTLPLILAFAAAIATGAVVVSAQVEQLPAGHVQFGAPLDIWILIDAVVLWLAIVFTMFTFRWWRRGGPLPDWVMGR